MKNLSKFIASLFIVTAIVSCKKDKKTDPTTPPAPTPTPQEVITTLRVYLWDSVTNVAVTGSPFSFKDADGEGGQAGAFLNNGLDSLIKLQASTTYKTKVVLLDETKNPIDSISNAIANEEGHEHLMFYNGDPTNSNNNKGNTILNANYPGYAVKLNGSNIIIRYSDSDNGASVSRPVRHIGLETYLKTSSVTAITYPFIITLRHQPENSKDGTYAPGETDVEVPFKVKVN